MLGTDELTSISAGGNTTTYAYTPDGQVSSQGTTRYTWDGWGRLSTATIGSNTVTYGYDPTGALKSRSSTSPAATTNYKLGDLFEVKSGALTSYTDGPAGNLASFKGAPISTSTVTFLYYDAHGNLAAAANSSGTLTASHTYDPFGAPTDSVAANSTVHRFVGRWDKQYDTASGLVLMGARPYDPNTGRFLAVDPIPGGSLNNYDYAGQDPVNGYDLDGTIRRNLGHSSCTGSYARVYGICVYVPSAARNLLDAWARYYVSFISWEIHKSTQFRGEPLSKKREILAILAADAYVAVRLQKADCEKACGDVSARGRGG
jgi:RHS repeat-associated protein